MGTSRKKQMCVYLDANTADGMRIWALAEDVPLTSLINRVLTRALRSDEVKAQMKKGLAELQAKLDEEGS